jgi:tRNA threonylcarbamoyladenosine biosynthesis protein TsaB
MGGNRRGRPTDKSTDYNFHGAQRHYPQARIKGRGRTGEISMILLLDTSTPICKLTLIDGDWRFDDEWEAGRTLAKELLGYLQRMLAAHDKAWGDISGIVAFQGPGSFTGLRIGLTVLNTFAGAQGIPIVGAHGESWQAEGLARLQQGENDEIVLPEYGSEANITTPRK